MQNNYCPGQDPYSSYPSPYPGYGMPRNYYPSNVINGSGSNTPINNQNGSNSNMPWILVPNIETARNVIVGPNQTAYLMSQNTNEFYVKSTDSMGVATIKYFKFMEFDPNIESAKQIVDAQSERLVSREEFNQFVNSVSNQFAIIQQNMTPQQAQQKNQNKKQGMKENIDGNESK